MEGLRDVEYLPEPSDRRIVSAVDPTVIGFQDQWRSETMGWAPLTVEPVVRHTAVVLNLRRGGGGLPISATVLMWQNQWLVVDLPPPTSEWAFEETDLRAVQADGLSGEGVRVCMVDTGVDAGHDAFASGQITFRSDWRLTCRGLRCRGSRNADVGVVAVQ